MALRLPPDLEERVTALALEVSRDPGDMLADLVHEALEDDAAFRSTVRAGLAELDRGEAVPHEAVMADLRAILAQHAPRPR